MFGIRKKQGVVKVEDFNAFFVVFFLLIYIYTIYILYYTVYL